MFYLMSLSELERQKEKNNRNDFELRGDDVKSKHAKEEESTETIERTNEAINVHLFTQSVGGGESLSHTHTHTHRRLWIFIHYTQHTHECQVFFFFRLNHLYVKQ